MSLALDRQTFGAVFDSWAGTAQVWPARADGKVPTLSSDLQAPAGIITWRLRYDNLKRATFGGTAQRDGYIEHVVWAEENSDDVVYSSWLDEITALWEAASLPAGYQVIPEDAEMGDELKDGNFIGQEFNIRFSVFEEPS